MNFLKWLVGGGDLKYRVIPLAGVWMIQVRGAGNGWLWHFVGWSRNEDSASTWAKYEAHTCGGAFIGVVK